MRFEILGKNIETGKKVGAFLEAESVRDAQDKAIAAGIFPEDVRPSPPSADSGEAIIARVRRHHAELNLPAEDYQIEKNAASSERVNPSSGATAAIAALLGSLMSGLGCTVVVMLELGPLYYAWKYGDTFWGFMWRFWVGTAIVSLGSMLIFGLLGFLAEVLDRRHANR